MGKDEKVRRAAIAIATVRYGITEAELTRDDWLIGSPAWESLQREAAAAVYAIDDDIPQEVMVRVHIRKGEMKDIALPRGARVVEYKGRVIVSAPGCKPQMLVGEMLVDIEPELAELVCVEPPLQRSRD